MSKAGVSLLDREDPKSLDKAANLLKAIAHPIRMAIIDLLSAKGKLSVTEIHETLKLEQAVASHHLGILRDKGVLDNNRQGKNTFYFLSKKGLVEVLAIVQKNLG